MPQPLSCSSFSSVTVAGQDASKGIQLAVLKKTVTGTYDCKGAGTTVPDATVSFTPQGENAYASIYYEDAEKVGSITISEIDEVNKTISGTFSSKVKRVVPSEKAADITSGSFTKIPYSTNAPASSSSLSAKVDGTLMNASIATGARAFGKLVLNGSTLDGKQIITITIPETATPGTYTFGVLGTTSYATYTLNPNTYESTSGSVKITAHSTTSKHIEGTFSFSAEPFGFEAETIAVTEGAFVITYN